MQEAVDWTDFVSKLDDAYSKLNQLELQILEHSAHGDFARCQSPKMADWLQMLVHVEYKRRGLKTYNFPEPPFLEMDGLELARALFLSATLAESSPDMPGIEAVSWLIHRIVLCVAIFELSKEEPTDG